MKSLNQLKTNIIYNDIFELIKNVPQYYLNAKSKYPKFLTFNLFAYNELNISYYYIYLCNKNKYNIVVLPLMINKINNIIEISEIKIVKAEIFKMNENTYFLNLYDNGNHYQKININNSKNFLKNINQKLKLK